MANKQDTETKGEDSQRRILRCAKCNTVIDCSPEDLMRSMRDGWPKCCQETMTLFIEAKLPGGAKS